ncbi:hypothetical protein [Rappaport israeli]|nr:hypothetical protein [Rappaport israeli]
MAKPTMGSFFFWWEMLQTSSFSDYKEISKQEAIEIQQNHFEYA